ncbi:hypothetical protein C8Q76DRAFT_566472, partial [Earliella scabrosa]
IVCTGFDVTEALRNYLTIGHNIDVDKDHRAPLVPPDELLNEPDSKYDPRLAELERETSILEDCQRYFRKIRAGPPAEDRKVLEIPYSYERRPSLKDDWHTRLVIPTGAYPREQYKSASGALKTAPEEDVRAIQAFIECANRLLPDDAAREKAGIKLEDLQFVVRSPRGFTPPSYRGTERQELLPPRHLRVIL